MSAKIDREGAEHLRFTGRPVVNTPSAQALAAADLLDTGNDCLITPFSSSICARDTFGCKVGHPADLAKPQQLIDCEGISLESEKPFAFSCCDCGLTHHMVIVSEDGKPVGFAVKRIELQVAEDTCQPARTMTVNVAAPIPAGVQGDAARDGIGEKYFELIYAVASKFPGESRHETALRYIRSAEEPKLTEAGAQSTEKA